VDKPKIFLSHSCKDSEISDAILLDDEQDPRRRRLKFARTVRDRVVEILSDRFTPLLDRELLDPGDRWRTKLLHWLGICDGAMILLSEDSIESRWVLQEATVLTWRKWLQQPFVLVPVVLGHLPKEKLAEKGFAPLQLDEIQAARLDAAVELNTANAELLADTVAQRFLGLAAGSEDNELQRWIEDVAVRLKEVDEKILARACTPLGIDDEDWAHFPDRPTMVASHLLYANLQDARKALESLKPGFTQQGSFAAIVALVLPIWVHAEAAAGIVAPSRNGAIPRAFALNTAEFDTARDYLQRAFCCPSWWNTRCLYFDEPLGEGQEEEAFERLRQHVASTLCIPPTFPSDMIRSLVEAYPFFVILGEHSPLSPQLRALMADSQELRSITCIQLAGLHFDAGPAAAPIIRLLPEILKEDEELAQVNKILLHNLAG